MFEISFLFALSIRLSAQLKVLHLQAKLNCKVQKTYSNQKAIIEAEAHRQGDEN